MFFIYEENWGAHFYDSAEEWKKAVDAFDFSGKFLDDGWDDSVENCFAGQVPEGFKIDKDEDLADQLEPHTLYVAEQCDRQENPNDLDEEGLSQSTGEYWDPEWNYKCNYHFAPVLKKEHVL